MKINFCSAPCGSGKTRQLIESASRLANKGANVLFLQPTKELIDKTIEQELQRRSDSPPYQKFYGASKGHSVARELMEYFHHPMECGHIVFATHQVLPFVRFWENQSLWHVFVDEELQVAKNLWHKVPWTHGLITDHIELYPYDAIYSRVDVTNEDAMQEIARNEYQDEIHERVREAAQILINPKWESFVNTEQSHKLMAGKAKVLSIHSILVPEVLHGFASVTMASANFEDTLIYKIWCAEGVKFKEDLALKQSLRFQEHRNGDLISIKYLTDLAWPRKLQGRLSNPIETDSQTYLKAMVGAVKSEFQNTPFLWQANKSFGSDLGENGQRLPNVPHGLNDYSDIDRTAFFSALNPKTEHFWFLKTRGVDEDSVRRAVYCSAVYQSVMRSSVRDPNNSEPKIIIVPDISAARYLQGRFPGSQVEKLKTELVDWDGSKNAGRPRKYQSDIKRHAEYRRRKKEIKSNEIVQLKEFPYPFKKSCGSENASVIGDETTIDIISHFVTHHDLHGTFYKHIKSKNPLGYLWCQNVEFFIEALATFHEQTLPNKDANLLFSPAIFDPNSLNEYGTRRGLKNIVVMRHLWMDFEDGDLKPVEIPDLFPDIRLLVFNTYSHTKESPRFRVVIPFDDPLSLNQYSVLYENIIAKIEDAGYGVGKHRNGHLRSGLDRSKKAPVSLFYLPCQAQDPTQSFFKDYNDDKRQILDPTKWIKNSVVLFPEKSHSHKPQQPWVGTIDEAKVAAATSRWHQALPGTGNDSFFSYALSLRSAGMPPEEIERKLEEEAKEAKNGQSEADRRRQIPGIMRSLQSFRKVG
jgi:hypothetical protein